MQYHAICKGGGGGGGGGGEGGGSIYSFFSHLYSSKARKVTKAMQLSNCFADRF